MSGQTTCREEVWEAPGYWHSHVCGRPVRFIVRGTETNSSVGHVYYVCGIHARTARSRCYDVQPLQAA